jgi:regulator of sirC expression with transglutaminase-like and TPR domain
MKTSEISRFAEAVASTEPDLASAALIIALIEYPKLDPKPYLARLDEMGEAVKARINAASPMRGPGRAEAHVSLLNEYLFDEQRFSGDRDHYEDPRNSFLNEVLERRKGIPITLAVVYLEVARRAGVKVDGVNFPGHFLLRCQADALAPGVVRDLIIDPFHKGALLTERDCRELLQRHVGDDAAFDESLLAPASKQQILTRMLLNLKRTYVAMRSFPQARDVTEMLLAVDPSALAELRDRGLIAYHLRDFVPALRDLQTYLRLSSGASADEESRKEHEQLWEHVKTLRRRVAGLN